MAHRTVLPIVLPIWFGYMAENGALLKLENLMLMSLTLAYGI